MLIKSLTKVKNQKSCFPVLKILFASLLCSLFFTACKKKNFSDAPLEIVHKFIKVKPNEFTEQQQPLVDAYLAENKALEDRGPIDVQALISGSLAENTPGIGPVLIIKEDMVRYVNDKYDPENRLLSDRAYAEDMAWKDILAYPTFAANDDWFMKPFPVEARDRVLVSDLNHSITFHLPVFPGDTLYYVLNKRKVLDNTPKKGSVFRSMVIQSEGSIYNQNGKKVNDVIFRITENVILYKKAYASQAQQHTGPPPGWIAPDWNSRPSHYYTDKDWEQIKGWWKDEKRQGAKPLYYEEVRIGDLPTITVDGPIMESPHPTLPYGTGIGGSKSLRKEILDPAIFKTLTKDDHGIYLSPNRSDYVPVIPNFENLGSTPKATVEEGKRELLANYVGRDIAIRHLHNWMGEKGWLQNIRWSIMEPPSIHAIGYGVPTSPWSEVFFDKIPSMTHKHVNTHGLTRDLAIVKSYVYDKYQKNGAHFVELAWWIETIDGYIFTAGAATIKLPSNS